jgi:hypothetical protein
MKMEIENYSNKNSWVAKIKETTMIQAKMKGLQSKKSLGSSRNTINKDKFRAKRTRWSMKLMLETKQKQMMAENVNAAKSVIEI